METLEENTVSLRGMSGPELQGYIQTLEHKVGQFEESLAQAMLHVDNMGWDPLGGTRRDETGLDLDHIKDVSKLTQALVTVNPLAKRGIAVRTSYVWGSGVKLKGTDSNRSLRRTLGTTEAQFELERTLACDGNLFLEVEGKKVRRIPLSQIAGAAEDPNEPGVITHILRKYRRYRASTSLVTDQGTHTNGQQYTDVEEFIPTAEAEVSPPTINLGGKPIEVSSTKKIKHVAINRLVGWWWGVPDLYAIMHWSKAYKEYLENCATLQEAYQQFAWMYKAESKEGMRQAADTIASAPSVNPMTGQSTNIGGAAVIPAGTTLSALQTIRPVDFEAGRPMAAMIAAGLEIPLQVLTSDAGSGGSRTVDHTLDEATKNAMIARQTMMDNTLKDIAEMLGTGDFAVDWPEIGAEPPHRQMQALDQGVRLGAFFPKEMRARAAAIARVDVEGKEEPPTKEELPAVLQTPEPAEQSPQPDPPSRGDHTLRNQGGQAHTDD